MVTVLVERARGSSVRQTGKLALEELMARLPDSGPLDIEDYDKFKRRSRAIFYEKWSSTRPFLQTAGSLSDFENNKLLGSGGFGYVVLVRHKPSQKLYALKCSDKEKIFKSGQIENLKSEKLMLQCINYPFTIYSLYTFKDNIYIYFVMPFVDGGDLFGHLQTFGMGREDHAMFWASQVILALEYLHYLDFVYRDLKPENILIDHTGYLKLADFGFTKRLKRRLRTYTLCGTPEYMAPEVILNKGYGKSVDWWAVGCFIYEMVAGRTPFVTDDPVRIYEKIISRRYKMPKFFSFELRGLVDKLLQSDLSKRYGNLKNGVDDIKGDKWLVTINWLAILNRSVEAPYRPKRPSLDLKNTSPWKLPKEGREDKYSDEFADF